MYLDIKIMLIYLDVKRYSRESLIMGTPDKQVAAPADHIDRLREQWARELVDLDTEPMGILGRAYWITRHVRQGIDRSFAKFGLDAGEFDVLASLRRAGKPFTLRPTELYKTLLISSGGLTDRLDRLESAGFVRRIAAVQDGRSIVVKLTTSGKSVVEAAFRADMAVEAVYLSGLAAKDRASLARLLRMLIISMSDQLPVEPQDSTSK
jgi:DNA-binding MarR family transcriptional regulator